MVHLYLIICISRSSLFSTPIPPLKNVIDAWRQDTWLYGSVSFEHRYLFSCKHSQRNSEQSIRMQITHFSKHALGPDFVFKMSFDEPFIHILKRRKTEIGNCTRTKPKAVSCKAFALFQEETLAYY